MLSKLLQLCSALGALGVLYAVIAWDSPVSLTCATKNPPITYPHNGTTDYESPEKCCPTLGLLVGKRIGAAWRFVIDSRHDIFDGLIAFGTIALAVGTILLFRETHRIFERTPDIERAYISGGGWLLVKPDGSPVFGEDGNRIFAVSVDNYGKTPGDLRWYAFEFCALNKIPMIPKYAREGYTRRREFFDRIGPGTMGRPIDEISYPKSKSEVVYGRHWFVDIWGKEHSSGFILHVKGGATGNTVPNILAPSKAYTDLDTCLGHYVPTKRYKRGDPYEEEDDEPAEQKN